MPVFRFGKERFDPDFSLVQGFLVGQGLLVAPHPFEIVCVEGSVHLPTLITGGTLRFEWTRITGGCVCSVFRLFYLVLHPPEMQRLTVGADVAIVRGVIRELGGSIISRHMLPIRERDVGANALIFQGLDVLDGSVFGVACCLSWSQKLSEKGLSNS